jgi:hypothetical protein
MMRGSRIATLVALLTAAAAAPALADNKPPSERDRQLASDLVKKAIARSQAGDHAAAIKIYLQAYTLVPNSLLLSNIGAEFQQDGLYKEALDYFCKYLEQDPAGTNAPYARSQAKILQRQLGHKRSDGGDVCALGKTDEPAGDPPARAERPAAGDRDTDRGADHDDKRPEKRDKPRERTAQRGHGDDAAGGEPIDAPAPPVSRGNPTLMYTGIAAGVAGLAAGFYGVYAGIQGKQISDQISSHDPSTPWPGNIRELQKRGEDYNRNEVISLVASGALVTTGVVLFVLSRPDAPEHTDKPVVGVAPTTNGLAVFGRF